MHDSPAKNCMIALPIALPRVPRDDVRDGDMLDVFFAKAPNTKTPGLSSPEPCLQCLVCLGSKFDPGKVPGSITIAC